MKYFKRSLLLLSAAGVIAVGLYFAYDWQFGSLSGYDRSIETVPGKPIRVARAIDGDTIVLINGDRLRYIGIDTPEEFDRRKPVQCWAREAAEANRKLVEGKLIVFTQDVTKRDKYGRWLGFVTLVDDGRPSLDVNAALVKNGYAFSYPYKPDTSRSAEFKTYEAEAKTKRLGLWSHCQITRVGARKQTNAVEPLGAH
jgi:micrococcal nuclease